MWGIGVTSLMTLTVKPSVWRARKAASLPTPGPLILTSAIFIPCSIACFTASFAASCAANGVLFRDPLKPSLPALEAPITFPSLSVMVTMVLLKVDWMWITPVGTFFFSFFAEPFLLTVFAILYPLFWCFDSKVPGHIFTSYRVNSVPFLRSVLSPEQISLSFNLQIEGLRLPSFSFSPLRPSGDPSSSSRWCSSSGL